MSKEAREALVQAIVAVPDDVALRLHLAELELREGMTIKAISTLAQALALDPTSVRAHDLLTQAMEASRPSAPDGSIPDASLTTSSGTEGRSPVGAQTSGFDWRAAQEDLGSEIQPAFVKESDKQGRGMYSSERPSITLAEVGGLDSIKERLDAAFLAPLRHSGLRQLYGKSLRGGLLMYGPPGCGKTFLAKAVAGELGAAFLSVSVSDVLDPYFGASERNLHELFMQARREAPCVVFLDELDTLGQRRTGVGSLMLGVVNQLLTEMDGFADDNDGVFVLAATNQPWQVDAALRRPGRLDRTLLVLPPDRPAREAIFRSQLRNRPVEGIDLEWLSSRTDGYSGADLAFVCEMASERALMDSVRTGEPRLIGMGDLRAALAEVRPSVGAWLDTARNFVQFGEDDGTHGELRVYLKKAKRL